MKLGAEISLGTIVGLFFAAFLCEYMDSTLGMGYGTTLVGVVLLFGFSPVQIVPAVLFSELITGFLAGLFHHQKGNVNFKPKMRGISVIAKELKSLGYIETFKKGIPLHLRVVLLLAVCSIIGTVIAVFVAVNIHGLWLKLYIGWIIFLMGIIILIALNKEFAFSWRKIFVLGLIASFNKGLSGGGYGPIVTSGQILSGINCRNAVGITSLSEGLTCLVGLTMYLFVLKSPCAWGLAFIITSGAVLSVPFSAASVKKIKIKRLQLIIAIAVMVLGAVTIIRTLAEL